MDFFNNLFKFLAEWLTPIGGITAVVGIVRFISGGKSHDAAQQEQSVWIVALGGVLVGCGIALAGGAIKFPAFPGIS